MGAKEDGGFVGSGGGNIEGRGKVGAGGYGGGEGCFEEMSWREVDYVEGEEKSENSKRWLER